MGTGPTWAPRGARPVGGAGPHSSALPHVAAPPSSFHRTCCAPRVAHPGPCLSGGVGLGERGVCLEPPATQFQPEEPSPAFQALSAPAAARQGQLGEPREGPPPPQGGGAHLPPPCGPSPGPAPRSRSMAFLHLRKHLFRAEGVCGADLAAGRAGRGCGLSGAVPTSRADSWRGHTLFCAFRGCQSLHHWLASY